MPKTTEIHALELDDIKGAKPSKNDDHWGFHLLVDMSGCNKNSGDKFVVEEFINELVKAIKMVAIGKPIVVEVDNKEMGRGVSALQLITTSNISYHEDAVRHCVYLDVFSCASYDATIVLDLIKKYFQPKHLGYKFVYRDAGEYPLKKSILTPSQLFCPAFLLNFPFSVDNEQPNNVWMKQQEDYDYSTAFSQFLDLYHYLAEEALVYLLPSTDGLQDQPFVANLGLYLPHIKEPTIIVANFKSSPRKGEESKGGAFFKAMGYAVAQPPTDWEGEADTKFVRDNLFLGGYGIRSDKRSYDWMQDKFDMEIITIKMTDDKLYHLDCNLAILPNNCILAATEVLESSDLKQLEQIAKIIPIPKEYTYCGWTNTLILGQRVLHAPSTNPELPPLDQQISAFRQLMESLDLKPVIFKLDEFDKSGADLSCLVFHLNYNNRLESAFTKSNVWWAERLSKLPEYLQHNVKSQLSSRVEWLTRNSLVCNN